MIKYRFIIISSVVVLSLALLCSVEAFWTVRSYREMRESYRRQIESVLTEASLQYMDNTMPNATTIKIGNIERLDALVGEGLRTSGIKTEYCIEVLTTTNQAPLPIMSVGAIGHDKRLMAVECGTPPLLMRLTVEDPHDNILYGMRWVLILQALSIVVLIVAFVYMLRTLFRAKSVERIRRDLTHNITHELKTPIAAAYAATDTLRTMPQLAEDARLRDEYLDMTLLELRRLGDMVDEILRNSTESHTSMQLRKHECRLADIVDKVVASVALKYSSRTIVWRVNVASDIVVLADSFHLTGAISAIVDNAVKYADGDVEVGIDVEERGAYTYLSIEDNGRGVARRELRRIFDKYYRIPQGDRHDSRGYGLGLYYARSVARRHGGDIEVRSKLNKGSCFTIKIERYGK